MNIPPKGCWSMLVYSMITMCSALVVHAVTESRKSLKTCKFMRIHNVDLDPLCGRVLDTLLSWCCRICLLGVGGAADFFHSQTLHDTPGMFYQHLPMNWLIYMTICALICHIYPMKCPGLVGEYATNGVIGWLRNAGDLQRATNARVQVENLGPEGGDFWTDEHPAPFFGRLFLARNSPSQIVIVGYCCRILICRILLFRKKLIVFYPTRANRIQNSFLADFVWPQKIIQPLFT